MSEPQDRDEAMDMLDEKRRGWRVDYATLAHLYALLEGENDRLIALVRGLRAPSCPVVFGERVTWEEFRRMSADGP